MDNEQKGATRDRSGRFLSNNAGRPKASRKELKALILERTNEGADLVDILEDLARTATRESVRLDAARFLAERVYGKQPEQIVTNTVAADSLPILRELSRESLEALAAAQAVPEGMADANDAEPLAKA